MVVTIKQSRSQIALNYRTKQAKEAYQPLNVACETNYNLELLIRGRSLFSSCLLIHLASIMRNIYAECMEQ